MIHLTTGTFSVGDYLEKSVPKAHIDVKEIWAIIKGLQSLPESVSDCRIDAQVDSMVVFHAWSGIGARSRKLTQISKWIFQLNRADWFSRKIISFGCYVFS